MRVQIVDPPAYTPPYDRCLCAALARRGADVELITSPFAYGPVPPADNYRVREAFYRRSAARPPGAPGRRALKLAEHVSGMYHHRSNGASADVIHYQWLPVPSLDSRLLPTGRPLLLTAHGILRREAWRTRPPRSLRRVFARMDAIITLSRYGARRLAEAGVEADRIHVIPHGAFDYLTRMADEVPLSGELATASEPVILCFGLIRPYKGIDVLLEAFRSVRGAELWIVGRPLGVALESLRALADRAPGTVRLVPRFISDREVAAYFRRADVVVLPHRDEEQSGVLYAALAFGKPIVMSDVGGFGEVAAHGAGRLVPPGDPVALSTAITALLQDPTERERLARASREAAEGPYSWDAVAARTLALYEELGG